MTLILNNEEVESLLTMEDLVPALEEAYVELVEGRGGNRVRSDIITPSSDSRKRTFLPMRQKSAFRP